MSKAKLRKEKKNDIYLFSTSVENIFINELLPIAPGDYVKVYLFGLMYAEQERPISTEVFSKALRLSAGEIGKAWEYWEKWGAVRLVRNDESDEYEIIFLNQIEEFYGMRSGAGQAQKEEAPAQAPAEKERPALEELLDRELQAVYGMYEEKTGKLISRTEAEKIRDAISLYGVTPDVYSYAIKYCSEREKINVEYISAVAMSWSRAGCLTISDVKRHLDAASERSSLYHKVFDELGFKRPSTPGDRELIDKWADEWGFAPKEILEACRTTAGLREPTLRYVDRVLENKYREYGGIKSDAAPRRDEAKRPAGQVSAKVLESYYQYIREQAEAEQRRRIEAVTAKVPLMRNVLDLERELRKGLLLVDFSKESKARRDANREKYKELEKEKADILSENGYPEDYLAIPYKCSKCKDTGVTDEGRYCSCRPERAEEAFIWNRNRQKQK